MAIAQVGTKAFGFNSKTGGVTVTSGAPSGAMLTGETIVVGVSFDNTGANTPTVTGFTNNGTASITWTIVGHSDSPSAASGTGLRTCIAIGYINSGTLGTGDNVTIAFSAAVAAIRGGGVAFSGVASTGAVRSACTAQANGTSTALSVPTASDPTSGDLVIAVAGIESTAIAALDADTTNGSWVSALGLATAGGAVDTNVSMRLAYKIVSGTGPQTYDATITSADWSGVIAAVQPQGAIAGYFGGKTATRLNARKAVQLASRM